MMMGRFVPLRYLPKQCALSMSTEERVVSSCLSQKLTTFFSDAFHDSLGSSFAPQNSKLERRSLLWASSERDMISVSIPETSESTILASTAPLVLRSSGCSFLSALSIDDKCCTITSAFSCLSRSYLSASRIALCPSSILFTVQRTEVKISALSDASLHYQDCILYRRTATGLKIHTHTVL